MVHFQYKQYEIHFLEDIALEAKLLNDEYKKIFINTCLLEYRDKHNNIRKQITEDENFLIAIYGKEALYGKDFDSLSPEKKAERKAERIKDKSNLVKEKYREIIPKIEGKLEQEGFRLTETKKWKEMVSVLQNSYFPRWFQENESRLAEFKPDRTLDAWQQLWNNATSENIIVQEWGNPTIEVADIDVDQPQILQFTWESKIYYDIKFQQPGYLILLQKFVSGDFYCLAPSSFLCNWEDNLPEANFPSYFSHANRRYVKVKRGYSGIEKVLAIVTEKKPELSWLPSKDEKPKKITDTVERDLQELLDFLESLDKEKNSNFEIIKTEYEVLASN